MQGSQGPSLRTTEYVYGTAPEIVAKSIREGYASNGMPAFGATLSNNDIQEMVEFLYDKRQNNDPAYLASLDEKLIEKIKNTTVHSELHDFRLEIIAELGKPWGMAALPNGSLLVTEEKTGKLRIIEKGKLSSKPIKNTPTGTPIDIFKRQIIDVAIHPDYEKNGWIYLTSGSSKKNADGKEFTILRLIRGRLKKGKWIDSQILFTVPRDTATGRIAFDNQGFIYLSVSADLSVDYDKRPDPFSRAELVKHPSQDINSPEGKIYRLNDDGSVPTDNPFYGDSEIASSVWSYGHRNAQGLEFDTVSNELWSTEHGPRGGDELNLIKRANNYGWPLITYGTRYDGISITKDIKLKGLQSPKLNWTPSIGVANIAFNNGSEFTNWKNDLLIGSMVQQELMRVRLEGDRVVVSETLLSQFGRIRDIEVGINGGMYLALELKTQGLVIQLIPVQ